ncbi:uncharacterized protein BROUX77_007238 [Berkeleyomyces rouxiae]|uniref:uncharacterized protein n=1 Tax=Berkeleyomyces rouxiae TaxID=2035830 RepID=UPI003B7888A3
MAVFNLFRILGDLSHASSKCILITAIHRNSSAEGVSLISQIFYALVFITRYTDLFQETYLWNTIFKIFYIFSSLYIVAIMQFHFPRTRELELSWKLGGIIFAGSVGMTPFVYWFSNHTSGHFFSTSLYDFSLILESVCILPQLLLLRQTSIPTVINSFYLLALGAYRALYVLNWCVRSLDKNDYPLNHVSVFFGIVQTILYADFFYVYYSRQRVKLRNGSIIDSDDMDRGWIINRLFGSNIEPLAHNDEENPRSLRRNGGLTVGGAAGNAQSAPASRAKWGARGISISADDDTLTQAAGSSHDPLNRVVDPDAKMKDPDELALALDDDDNDSDNEGTSNGLGRDASSDEESDDDVSPDAAKKPLTGGTGVRNDEWRD